ncbi:MAG: T9SS type A sorting domain-containing protein [Ferruginibacter sp.]
MNSFYSKLFTTYLMSLILSVFLAPVAMAQVPGFINRPATNAAGRLVLDPNGDGYTSLTTSGFGTSDVSNSEIPFKGIKAYSIEPYGDLRRGPNHAYSDFVPDSSGNGVYHYFSAAQNVLFRMRMGSIMPGSKGYSILLDTDGKFGATGPNADPNYIASTTGTNGNPGFEIEVVLETNFRIAIYNVDGTSSPVMVKQYLNWQDMSQVSIASTNDNGDPDYLIDFYIPFSDLQAAPFNLTAASSIRMCATTVMSPQAATGGPRSDIYGTAGDSYEDFINGQPACNIFNNPTTCNTAMCTAAPEVSSPISTGTVNISGTWTKSALPGAASTATITVYKNGSSVGTISAVSSGSTWTLNSIALVNGDIITAKAVATGETMCLTSNAVAASTCNASNIPPTPVLSCTSGSKGITGTNLSTGWTVHVDNITRNVLDNSVANATGLFGANTGTSPNITWLFSGGCSTGAPLNSGSYKVYYTSAAGCNSLPVYFCAAGNGGSALAGSLAVPVITAPANAVFTTATKTISGTTTANATATLYINGLVAQTVTATGGNFSFTGLNLLNGQQLYVVVELNTGTVSTSMCANQTPVYTVSCFTNTPVINADNNGQLTAGAPITGTSTEPAGTSIRVYTSGNTLVATTAVQANGTWSTGNAGTTPATYNAVAATSYYANAQNGTCGLSGNSASFTTLAQTAAGRCGTITGPVAAGATSISGTLTGSFSTSTVNLYLDGQLIGSTVTSGTAWGPITVNSTINNTLYPNGVLSIGIQESGKQEVFCPASAQAISCTPTPVAPVYSPANTSILRNQTITYTISNAVAGTFYALADSATGQQLGQGIWATANGNLSITTSPFNSSGTFTVVFRSTSLSGVTQCSSVSSSGSVNVSFTTLPLTLIQFKGKKQANGILLDWNTANETGVNRFEIERSANGSAFERLGKVMAAGNGSSAYAFTDNKPLDAMNYYRLKMIDQDGRYTYSNTIVFMGSRSKAMVLNSIRPNPFNDEINLLLVLQQAQPVTVQLVDLTGRVVATRSLQAREGDNTIVMNGLHGLADGIYYVRIVAADALLQQKVLKGN